MLALDEAMAAPPPPPPAPSAFDAEVRRQRAELRNLPEHAIRSIHLLEHGGPRSGCSLTSASGEMPKNG